MEGNIQSKFSMNIQNELEIFSYVFDNLFRILFILYNFKVYFTQYSTDFSLQHVRSETNVIHNTIFPVSTLLGFVFYNAYI